MSVFVLLICAFVGYYRDNRYDRTYGYLKQHMYELQNRRNIYEPLWAREFPIAFEDTDDFWKDGRNDKKADDTIIVKARRL